MFVTGLGISVPASVYTQHDSWEALQASPQFPRLLPRSQALLRKVLTRENGLRTRHLALDHLSDAFQISPDTLHARFRAHAPVLARNASLAALDQAGCPVGRVDAVLISTCTGYLCPGLTSYLMELLQLKAEVITLDLVGQGCGAAIPNLATASALIQSRQARRVLSVCVEVCSAAMFLDDDPGVLVSACLFADGAAAVVLSDEPVPGQREVRWCGSSSITAPEDRGVLQFEQRGGTLRNVLRLEVPERAAQHAERVLEQHLSRSQIDQGAISTWLFHPGGRLVLAAIGRRLGMHNGALRWSAGVLRDYGNVSSPSVLFALKRALDEGAPEGWWWMSAFGAGFSSHGALLRVRDSSPTRP